MNTASSNNEFPAELEARLVALILGEASDFEREELTLLLEQRPLLAARFAELTQVHALMENVGQEDLVETNQAADVSWKLTSDKREHLLSVLSVAPEESPATEQLVALPTILTPTRRRARQRFRMLAFGLGIASCVGGLAAMPYYYLDSPSPLMDGIGMLFPQSESTTFEATVEGMQRRFGYAYSEQTGEMAAPTSARSTRSVQDSEGIAVEFSQNTFESALADRFYDKKQSFASGLANRVEAPAVQRQLGEIADATGQIDQRLPLNFSQQEEGFIDTLNDVDRSSTFLNQGLTRGSRSTASASTREFEGENKSVFGESQGQSVVGGVAVSPPATEPSNVELGYAMSMGRQISDGLAAAVPHFEAPSASGFRLQVPAQLDDQVALLGLDFRSSGNVESSSPNSSDGYTAGRNGRDYRYLAPPTPSHFFSDTEENDFDFGGTAVSSDDTASVTGGAAFGVWGAQPNVPDAARLSTGQPLIAANESPPSAYYLHDDNHYFRADVSQEQGGATPDIKAWAELSPRRALSRTKGLSNLPAPLMDERESLNRSGTIVSNTLTEPEDIARYRADQDGELDSPAVPDFKAKEEAAKSDNRNERLSWEMPAAGGGYGGGGGGSAMGGGGLGGRGKALKQVIAEQSDESTGYDKDVDTDGLQREDRFQENAPADTWMLFGNTMSAVDPAKDLEELELLRSSDSSGGVDIPRLSGSSVTAEAEPARRFSGLSTDWYEFIPPSSDSGIELKERKIVKESIVSQRSDETNAQAESFSTFSLHVGDVSFKLAQAALAKGEWPNKNQVRIEEFVNAFDYGDPVPTSREKVACQTEQCIHPFMQQRNMLRIAMRTSASGRASQTPLRLTLLLDNSGSMERSDRKQTVRRAFDALASQLTAADQVTLISFARSPRLLADGVSGAQAQQLSTLIDQLPSEGGTNVELALNLAAEKAKEHFLAGAQNRVILLTDGAVNLGDANPQQLASMVVAMRDSGLAFDAAGISADGLNDEVLESLARQGDGRYYLLDSAESVDQGFARQIAGALRPSAKNVKVQVEFNPRRVGRYKLLGFEKHELKQEDFRNDSVDAAEMAAAEAGVAMYQIEAKPDGEGDVGSVSVRFRDIETGQMVENRWPIPYVADTPRLEHSPASIQLATTASMLAAKLRSDPIAEAIDLKTLAGIASNLPPLWRATRRVEQLNQMIEQTRQLVGK